MMYAVIFFVIIKIYEEEIAHLNEGGNLEAVSIVFDFQNQFIN